MRYWVVGGEYCDCCFKKLVPGTETVHGPYHEELHAQNEWKRLTYRDHCTATMRYSIAVEPGTHHAPH